MAKKIYENGWWYDHLRYITDAYIRASYRKMVFEGLDKIPADGALIFAPNHCCALMDPLAMLIMAHEPMVFVARADIFANPLIAKVLTFLKIMPINRIRDGFRSVAHTAEAIEKSVEVLNNKVRFCILSEGTHRPMHSLLPIGKGIARVACGAAESQPDKVYIVPVGLEYGDYFRFRTTLQVRVGDPIDVKALLDSMPEALERERMDAIRSRVRDGLKENIVFIGDGEDYDAVWEMAKISSGGIPPLRLRERFEANRAAVARFDGNMDAARALFSRVRGFTAKRHSAGVSLESLAKGVSPVRTVLRTLLGLVLLPLYMAWAAVSLPVWLPSEIVAGRLEDKAFKNSFRCGILVFGWTLMLLIWAVVLFCCLKWYWALAALAVMIPAPFMTYDAFNFARMTLSDWKALGRKELRREYEELKKEIKKI